MAQKLFFLIFLTVFFKQVSEAQNVGIGTNTPGQTLDVNGWIKLGDQTAPVPPNTNTAGSVRYNSTKGMIEYNNTGTAAGWVALAPNTYAVPQGAIMMWSGSFASIPSGWVLCNGSNGTPNLANQFILGATVTTDVGTTGGNNSITLTVAQIPSHTHTGTTDASAPSLSFNGTGATITPSATLTGATTDAQGAGQTGNMVWDDNGANGYYASGTLSLAQGDRNRSWGGSGGNAMRKLNLANHTHNVSGTINVTGAAYTPQGSISGSSHTHTFTTGSAGSGASIDIRPAFYKLAFIMKL